MVVGGCECAFVHVFLRAGSELCVYMCVCAWVGVCLACNCAGMFVCVCMHLCLTYTHIMSVPHYTYMLYFIGHFVLCGKCAVCVCVCVRVCAACVCAHVIVFVCGVWLYMHACVCAVCVYVVVHMLAYVCV